MGVLVTMPTNRGRPIGLVALLLAAGLIAVAAPPTEASHQRVRDEKPPRSAACLPASEVVIVGVGVSGSPVAGHGYYPGCVVVEPGERVTFENRDPDYPFDPGDGDPDDPGFGADCMQASDFTFGGLERDVLFGEPGDRWSFDVDVEDRRMVFDNVTLNGEDRGGVACEDETDDPIWEANADGDPAVSFTDYEHDGWAHTWIVVDIGQPVPR